MKNIKKLIISLFMLIWGWYIISWTCLWAEEFYYAADDLRTNRGSDSDPNSDSDMPSTDFWKIIKDKTVDVDSSNGLWKESLLNRSLAIFNLDEDNNEKYTWPKKALAYAIYLINYALWFVAFIALCLLIYSFYCVVVGDQKQIDKAKSYLKWIAIAIVVMGLSWLITSLIFRIYDDVAKDAGDTIETARTFNFKA